MNSSKYIFWLDDISILYKNNKYLEFIPTISMTKIEQLNAITRCAIYFSILVLLFSKSQKYIIISIIVILATIYMNAMFKLDNKGKLDEHLRMKNIEKFGNTNEYDALKEDKKFDINIKPKYANDVKDGKRDIETEPKIEAGYYDFANKINISEKYDPPKYKRYKEKPFYSLDDHMEYQKGTCRRPTVNNPFMNPHIIDFNDGQKPTACNSNDNEINEDIVDKFNKNLYKNVDDIFETEISKRQFYTIPSTSIPNQQTEFANWLWKPRETCKEDQANCLRWEDLRFKR